MSEPGKPWFLARGPYRQRRLRDLAKSLPVFGTILLCIPLLWPSGSASSAAMIYVFAVWWLLIIVAAALSVAVREPRPNDEPQ